MKKAILLFVAIVFFYVYTAAVVFTSIDNGPWSDPANWDQASVPGKSDEVNIVGHAIILDVDMTTNPGFGLYINATGSLTSETNEGIMIKSALSFDIAGTLNVYSIDLQTSVLANISEGGSVTTETFTDNDAGATFTINGEFSVGTTFDNTGTITGNGSITAGTYINTGTIFGITTTPSPGSTMSGWTWTGTISAVWGTDANWGAGTFPINTSNVSIPSGGTQPIISSTSVTRECNKLDINLGATLTMNAGTKLTLSGALTNNGTLTINSDGTGTGSFIDNGTINNTGTMNVKRYITQDIYHYLSSPVSAQALTLLQSGEAHTDFDLFWYDEDYAIGGPAWIDASAQAGNMDVGLGYAYTYNPADPTLEFTGTTNTGTINEPITYTYDGGISTDTWYFGWNLVGNPYPSRINATTFINDNSNIYGTLYFWDEAGTIEYADYATRNISGGTAGGGGHTPNAYIGVGQAFMVHTTTVSTSVLFNNDMRVHDAEAYFFKGEVQRFKIGVENTDGVYNETLIAFLEGTTTGFDNKYDGYKLKGNPNIALYTKLVEDDGYDYAIQGLPPLTDGFGVTVKLGLDAGLEGIYTFNVVDIENFHDTTSIFLEDLYENITVNLRKTSEYTFNVNEPGSITNRFLLHFNTSALGIDEPENINNRINVYTYDNIICVENYNPVGDIYFEVYNTLGQQLISRKLVNQQKNEITLNAGRGIYIVRIICEDKVFSSKVYLND